MPQVQCVRYTEAPLLNLTSEESEDERLERRENERRQRIQTMLEKLLVSSEERQFIINTAEKVVDLICDDYVRARTAGELNPQCICAAATVAMMIVADS